MQIAIVDDSAQERRELRGLLASELRAAHVAGTLFEYEEGRTFLADLQPGRFQIVFLDIYLTGENGMDLARAARQVDPDCRLVFFTRSYDHAVDSYQVRASYYLTKPLDPSRLRDALAVCLSGLSKDSRCLDVRVKGAPLRLSASEIYYVDCENRTVRIHLKNKSLAVSDLLSQVMDTLLEDPRFLRCNRGLLVNMDHIHETREGEFVLTNGARVPLRIRARGELKKAYLSYSLQELRKAGPT